MSNVIPPLISDSPPPMHVDSADEEEDEDDFGRFASALGSSATNHSEDGPSLPPTPLDSPTKSSAPCSLTDDAHLALDKDYQDKRKEQLEGFFTEEPPELSSCALADDLFYDFERPLDVQRDDIPSSDDSSRSPDDSIATSEPSSETKDFRSQKERDISSRCTEDVGLESESAVKSEFEFVEYQEAATELPDLTVLSSDSLPPPEAVDDDFGDFASSEPPRAAEQLGLEDDNNFADFESLGTLASAALTCDVDEIRRTIAELFPSDSDLPLSLAEDSGVVLPPLRLLEPMSDVTETMAVRYSWSKSRGQGALLRALNIDTRNILHGWKSSVPKFAATLSSAPLEPVRGETSANGAFGGEVPKAQFDWSGAGLTNPLDCSQGGDSMILLDMDSLVASLDRVRPDDCDARSGNVSPTPLDEQPPKKPDADSVKSLQLPTSDDEFDDFQAPLRDGATNNTLRESHIAATNSAPSPEEAVNCATTPPPKTADEEDEFADFQMSLPPPSTVPVPAAILQPTVVRRPETAEAQIEWPDPGLSDADLASIERSLVSLKAADDEWTDFVSVSAAKPKSVSSAASEPKKERTMTPELPLCVPHLHQLQPPRQPIPVITPTGLLQTRIPSNALKPPQRPQYFQQQQFSPFPQQMAPSIISQQFAQQNNIAKLPPATAWFPGNGNNNAADEDDWTEFVSSRPVANGAEASCNGYKGKPNIIPNPAHFDSFRAVPEPEFAKTTRSKQ